MQNRISVSLASDYWITLKTESTMPFILCLRALFNLSNAVMCPLAGTSCIVFLLLLSLLFSFLFFMSQFPSPFSTCEFVGGLPPLTLTRKCIIIIIIIIIIGKPLFYLSIIQSTLESGSTAYVHCLSQALYNKLLAASRLALKRIVFLG